MNTFSANLSFRATKMLHTAHGPQLFDVAFEMPLGKLMAIYGPSGAGKTTILRVLAGLTSAGSGHIRMSGETWLDTEHSIDLPTRHRSIGFVFQDFALFPHLTVREQLEFALPKNADKFIPRLTIRPRVVPATLRNDAGIVGAAMAAAERFKA